MAWWLIQNTDPSRLVGHSDRFSFYRGPACRARECCGGQGPQRGCKLIHPGFIVSQLLYPSDRPFKSNTHSDPKLATTHIIPPWSERTSTGRCQSYCQKYLTRSRKRSRIIFLLQTVLVHVHVLLLVSYLDLDWTSIKAIDTSMKVLARAMNRILVGLPLCMLWLFL